MVIKPEFGQEYMHKEYGKVTAIAVHPHDGACYIIELGEEYSHKYIDCERSELYHLTDSPPT